MAKTSTPPTPRGGGDQAAPTPGGRQSALSSPVEILGSEVFVLNELMMAVALGLPARTLQNVRVKKLARGRDWELDGNTALLTEKSLPVFTLALGLHLTATELDLLAKKSRAASAPVRFDAVVCRLPQNPKLLTVKWTEAGLERTANIITSRRNNFRMGMVVPIRLNPASSRYELTRPAPRQKGKW